MGGLVPGGTGAVKTAVMRGIAVAVITEVRGLDVDELHRAGVHLLVFVRAAAHVVQVRVRWIGHRLHAEVNVAADSKLSLEEAHELAKSVRHELLHSLTYLSNATIHVDPASASGEEYHRIESHAHDGIPHHSH